MTANIVFYPVVTPALTTLRRPDFLAVHRFARTVWLRLSWRLIGARKQKRGETAAPKQMVQ
jgi:hypothetical protein